VEGAVFRLSANGSIDAPRSYTVEAGKTLEDALPLATGDVVLTGPGAFHRRFRADPALAVEVHGRHDRGQGGRLQLALANQGDRPLRLTIAPQVYPALPSRQVTLAPGARLEQAWPLAGSGGWYDLVVTAAGSERFLCRLAGRVETGKASISDPAMG
jgi:phospholipase C